MNNLDFLKRLWPLNAFQLPNTTENNQYNEKSLGLPMQFGY